MYRVRSLISLFSLIILLSACGYRFRSVLPGNENELRIENIENESVYAVENDIENSLESKFRIRGIKIKGSASLILKVTLKGIDKRPSLYDESNIPVKYDVVIKMCYVLLSGEEKFKDGEVSDRGEYIPVEISGIEESAVIIGIIDKISDKIAENCLDQW